MAIDPQRKQLGVIDVPTPVLDSGAGVLLRTLEVGVCGTDREICAFEYGTPPPGSPHLILGHEALAEVVALGPGGQSGLAVGDLVVPMVRRPCDHPSCAPCRHQRQDFCSSGDYRERGIMRAHGFMAELFTDEERYLNRVPPALRDVAVLVEPLTISEKAVAQLRAIEGRLPWLATGGRGLPGQGRRALVLGAGPVGLLGAMKLLREGFEVFVYARSKGPNAHTRLVERIGATYVSGADTPAHALARTVGTFDVVLEAIGAPAAIFDLFSTLGRNGTFVLSGVPGAGKPLSVDAAGLLRTMVLSNQVVCGTVNASKADFESAIADLAAFSTRWPGAVAALISGRHRPEEAADLLTHDPSGIKEVIRFQ
jgi:threonine dehydrogenase-like Zn-dependent dehydrogenase